MIHSFARFDSEALFRSQVVPRSKLVHGRQPITADTALRIGLYFRMEPRYWMNVQAEYDMRVASHDDSA